MLESLLFLVLTLRCTDELIIQETRITCFGNGSRERAVTDVVLLSREMGLSRQSTGGHWVGTQRATEISTCPHSTDIAHGTNFPHSLEQEWCYLLNFWYMPPVQWGLALSMVINPPSHHHPHAGSERLENLTKSTGPARHGLNPGLLGHHPGSVSVVRWSAAPCSLHDPEIIPPRLRQSRLFPQWSRSWPELSLL